MIAACLSVFLFKKSGFQVKMNIGTKLEITNFPMEHFLPKLLLDFLIQILMIYNAKLKLSIALLSKITAATIGNKHC